MPYTSDTAPEQLLQMPRPRAVPAGGLYTTPWQSPVRPDYIAAQQVGIYEDNFPKLNPNGIPGRVMRTGQFREGGSSGGIGRDLALARMGSTLATVKDRGLDQLSDTIYEESKQRLAKRQTNGTDLTAVQTRKATPETPKYTSAVDIFKQYATKPDDGPEQQALDYAQTHRGLYAVTDFVASLANVISAAHGATPQQMTSLSAANGQRIQQLRQIQEARRQRYEQGLMSAALSDAQYNNQREERLRQEAREDAYRKQQQDNTDRAFRAQQEQQEENLKLRKAEQACQDKYRRDSLDVKSSIAAANAAIRQGAAETAKLKNDIIAWQKSGINIGTGSEQVLVDRQWYQNQKENYTAIRERLQALVSEGNDAYKKWLDRIETASAVNYTDEKAKIEAFGAIVSDFLKSGLPYAQEIIAAGVKQHSDAYSKLTGGAADTIPWADNNGGVTEIPWPDDNGGTK